MRRKVPPLLVLCGACIVAVLCMFTIRTWKAQRADMRPQENGPGQAAVKRPSDTGLAETAGPADRVLDGLVTEKVNENSPAAVSADLELKRTREKRGATMHNVVPYSQVEASLKDEIRKEKDGVSKEKIAALVAEAAQFEEEFWAKGDFDNASSFDDIYRARAAIELCLEVDPSNEAALKQLIEVLQAGWPIIISEKDDGRLVDGAKANHFALYAPLWTLWEQHISKTNEPTPQDLERAVNLINVATPPDVYAALAEAYRQRNPSASKSDLRKAAMDAANERKMRVLDWAIAACDRSGATWDVYADPLRKARDAGPSQLFAQVVVPTSLVPRESVQDVMRYDLGRFSSFMGPKSRAEKKIPYHEIKWNRPVVTH